VTNGTTLAYLYRGAGGTGTSTHYTPYLLTVLRGLEVNVTWETEELFGTDSLFRVDEGKHHAKVEIKINWSKWDCGVTSDWMMSVLRPSGKTGAIEDTNTHFTNGAVFTILGSDAVGNLEIVCGKTFWTGLPTPFPENDFVVRSITGVATKASFHSF
jgi:hypothetical protein